MMMTSQQPKEQKDPGIVALEMIEKSNKEFRDHHLWKELNCSPEQFFQAVEKHVEELDVPEEKWNQMYEQVKQAHKTRANERQSLYRPINMKLIGAMRV